MLRQMSAVVLAVVLAVATVSCGGGGGSPTAPTPATAAGPPAASPSASAAVFEVALPVAPGDSASNAYGIWPFGVHGSSHAADGHPGFDIEFRPGASVLAAADGTVQNVSPDSETAGRYTIRLNHTVGGRSYATDYTNVTSPAAGIAPGATVTRGQPLGLAGVQTQFIGTSLVTWAMTHFQVNDFSKNEGLTNPNAVSPLTMLSNTGRSLFDSLWANAAYGQELTEPFATNDRNTPFPLTRTWTTSSAGAVARIDFTHTDPRTSAHTYDIRSGAGDLIESGTAVVSAHSALSTIDLTSQGGLLRRGVYDIVDRTMRLNLGDPGATRPASLANAPTYTMR